MSEWRPIETAPKAKVMYGEEGSAPVLIILASRYGHRAIGYWGSGINPHGREGWVNPHDHRVMEYWNSFTHWMPLPEGPSD